MIVHLCVCVCVRCKDVMDTETADRNALLGFINKCEDDGWMDG